MSNKYLFTFDGASGELNTLDSGMYRLATYAAKSNTPIFKLDPMFERNQYKKVGQMYGSGGVGNNPISNIPIGPCGIPNLMLNYMMQGSFDTSESRIQYPTYGTAKIDFDLYSSLQNGTTYKNYYALDCYLKSLHQEFSLGASWSQSGAAVGKDHNLYTGTTVVDNGFPDDGTDAIEDNFDTLESPTWNATAVYPKMFSIDWVHDIGFHLGDAGKYSDLSSSGPTFGVFSFIVFGWDTVVDADIIAKEARSFTYTMGKSKSTHSAAITLSNCRIEGASPQEDNLNSIPYTLYLASFENCQIVESNGLDSATFYPDAVA